MNNEKKRVILFGAGEIGSRTADFIKYNEIDGLEIFFCDSNSMKIGSRILECPVISYKDAKEKGCSFIVSVGENYKDEIKEILKKDMMKYYVNASEFLQEEIGIDKTTVERNFCAWSHREFFEGYFKEVESDRNLNIFWGKESIFFKMFQNLNLDSVIELACGRGRHVERYYSKTKEITLVDILSKNIDFCKKRFSDKKNITYYQNNGFDLSGLNDENYTSLFTYDAMVHFEMFDIYSYLNETYRVLKRGGMGLFHHSNLALKYDQTFANPYNLGGRNFMNKDLFAYLAFKAGFEIVEQHVIDWSMPNMDCITLVRKPVQ